MWRSRSGREEETVTCIACGCSLSRSSAREYDKYGDRWDRTDKTFEHLCKECHTGLCHQPRAELEGLLVEIDAGHLNNEEFFRWYCALVEERYGPLEEQ